MMTVAFGITEPEGSVIVPEMLPVTADHIVAAEKTINTAKQNRELGMRRYDLASGPAHASDPFALRGGST